MPTLSLCMIVRDEEPVLARCLESVRDACDEIIIVDTGSHDRTKEIASRYTEQLYDFPWTDDFSAARNFSFSKAGMDYILWLDADDVVESAAELCSLKATLTADAVMLPYHTDFDASGRPVFTFYRERILKRECNFQWEGAVHEAITPAGTILFGTVAVLHKKLHTNDPERNLRILQKLKDTGELHDTRLLFYYARELYSHGRYAEAMEAYDAFFKRSDSWIENRMDGYVQYAACLEQMHREHEAVRMLCASFAEGLPRARICCEIGRLFMKEQKYAEAVHWYETALHSAENAENGGFYQADYHDYIPYMQLCVCCDRMGNTSLAQAYNAKAGRIKPDDPAYLWNLKYFQEKNSNQFC